MFRVIAAHHALFLAQIEIFVDKVSAQGTTVS